MTTTGSDLRVTFVDAYPRYVSQLLFERGIEVNAIIADAVVEGVGVLDALLLTLDEQILLEQRSSPLELFREALRPVDRALFMLGTAVPQSGSGARRVAPWDRYGLSPGSSKVLGEAAHAAHLSWGITKAAALAELVDATRGPTVGIFGSEDDRRVIVNQAERANYRTVILPATSTVSVAVVSADVRGANDVVRSVSDSSKVIVYGDAIDDLDQIRFMSLGASTTVHRDAVLVHLADHLPPLV